MTSKLTREQLHERARENVNALKMASRQQAFESAREEILADLQLAELALATMDSEPVMYCMEGNGLDPEAVSTRREVVDAWVNEWNTEDRSLGEPIYSTVPLYRHAQPAPVVPDNRAITQHFDTIALETAREILCDVNRCHEFLGGDVQLLSRIQCRIDDACRAAMLQAGDSSVQDGNSPAIPDGYVMVPMRLTAENGAKAALLGEFNLEYSLTCHECFGEGCDDCSGEGTWTNTIPIDWTTIKEIWVKGVEHFAAARPAPKQENI